jgi:hypothetical protein
VLLVEASLQRVDAGVHFPPLVRDFALALGCRLRREPEVDLVLQAIAFGCQPRLCASQARKLLDESVTGGIVHGAFIGISASRFKPCLVVRTNVQARP